MVGFYAVLSYVILAAALLFMVKVARGSNGPAKSWADLRSYDLEGQMWAVVLISGMAVGAIVQAVGGGVTSFSAVALGVGIWCGVFRKPDRFSGLVPGTVGAVASVYGSIDFVTRASSDADRIIRGGIMFCLAALFVLAAVTRVQPLRGLTWFAALDVIAFLAGPGGASWVESHGWHVGALSLIGIGAAVTLALMPTFVIALAALAVAGIQVLGSAFGYLPGDLTYSFGPIVMALVGFWITRAARTRIGV
ncbi:hypothetical protein [Raineyella fluvialis]|uniref:Uncharacterized protein n=1 Tax=Raineyella fluvialis TaxID=2662261 RepID=A0A5Q2F6S7_9ACTN|nr:hypothetical protein [Raineyella fluvialis]QGF22690.1 hypothetical protein Rai3103_02225 [Raineyella fluvialis]